MWGEKKPLLPLYHLTIISVVPAPALMPVDPPLTTYPPPSLIAAVSNSRSTLRIPLSNVQRKGIMIFSFFYPPAFLLKRLAFILSSPIAPGGTDMAAESNRGSTLRTPLSNVEREGEKEADAGRRNRDSVDRWAISRSRVVVAPGPIHTPSMIPLPATIIIIAARRRPMAPIAISGERRPHGYAADQGGEEERHQDLTDD